MTAGERWHVTGYEEVKLVIRRVQKMEADIKAGKKKVFPLHSVAKEAGKPCYH